MLRTMKRSRSGAELPMRNKRRPRATNETESDFGIHRVGRIGFCTVNVQLQLATALHGILKMASEQDIAVVVVQEVGVRMNGRHAIRSAAATYGYGTWFGNDRQHGCHVITFCRLHADEYVVDASLDFDGRAVWLQVHRPHRRPWLVCNLYGHANDPAMRDTMINRIGAFARATNETVCILGDFNCTDEEGAVANLLSNGVLHNADDSFGVHRYPAGE